MLTLMAIIFIAITVVLIHVGSFHITDKGNGLVAVTGAISAVVTFAMVVADVILLLNIACYKPAKIEYDKAACQVEIIEANEVLTAKVKKHEKQDGKSYGTIDPDTFLQLNHELDDDKDICDAIVKIQESEQKIKDLDRKLNVELPIWRFLVYFGH